MCGDDLVLLFKKSAANQEEGKNFFLTRKVQGWLSHMSLM